MGKQVEASAPPGAPDWIVTFADMISLLVTFFILLMTFSSMEAFDAFQAKGDLTGTTGTLSSSQGADMAEPPEQDLINAMDALRGAQQPHRRPTKELLENLENMGQRKDDEHIEIDLKALKDGMVIRYDERGSFAPGSVELSDYLSSAVAELARTLENYPYTVVIEGHTDDRFRPTVEHPDDMALAAARASTVADRMLAASGLDPLQVQIAAVGSEQPMVDNETPEGRRLNRRVEIRVVSLSERRAAALAAADALEARGE